MSVEIKGFHGAFGFQLVQKAVGRNISTSACYKMTKTHPDALISDFMAMPAACPDNQRVLPRALSFRPFASKILLHSCSF